MVDIANFRRTDVGARFDSAYARGNQMREDGASMRAGNALRTGDYDAAASELYGSGMLEDGVRVQARGQAQKDRVATAAKSHEQEGAKYLLDAATRISAYREREKDPGKALEAFDTFAGKMATYDSPEEIAQLRQKFAADPDGTLALMGAGAAKHLGFEVQGSGDEVLVIDKGTGKLVNRFRGARTTTLGEGAALAEIPGSYGEVAPAPQAQPGAMPVTAPQGRPDVNAVWSAAKQQESGGRGDAIGPDTRYGNAEGSTQMLPATAEAMARKLGLPWNPALMRENSPRALDYQDKLGRAYFDEGLEKYGGDPAKALAYYHGGPNEELWGPKTQAHVQAVMGRVQPSVLAGGAGEDTLEGGGEPAGVRIIAQRPKAPKEREAPSGYTYKPDGTLTFIPGGPADPQAQQSSGKVTEGERTAGFLSSRLASSLSNLTSINSRDPESGKPGFWEAAAEHVPYTNGAAANVVRSADRQQVIANQLDILDAALTLGTGAAYTREQLENYRATYFPLLTDKPETVAAKKQKLVALLNAAQIKAGAAAPPELKTALEAARAQFGVTSQPAAPGGKPAPPQRGQVVKGYRYNGGDPSSASSWSKVQ